MFTSPFAKWLLSQATNLATKKATELFFKRGLEDRLRGIVSEWCDRPETRNLLLSADAIFPATLPSKWGNLPPKPIEVFNRLVDGELPTAAEWQKVLVRQWQWVKEHTEEPTDFFLLEDSQAASLLGDLGNLLQKECERDAELFQLETLRQLRTVRNEVAELSSEFREFTARFADILPSRALDALANSRPTEGHYHAAIDAAVVSMKNGALDVALFQLEELKKKNWDGLTDRERFRVVANIGHVYNAKEQYDEAGRYFIESRRYQPDDEQARCLEAVGHSMLGDREEAFCASKEIVAVNPSSDLGWATYIRNSPEEVSFDDLYSTIPEKVRSQVDTAFALSWRAAAAGKLELGEKLACAALSASPTSLDVKERLATILMEFGRKEAAEQCSDSPRLKHREKVIEAERHLNELLVDPRLPHGKPRGRIRFCLGATCTLLGKAGAEAHVHAALDADPTNAQYARHLALHRIERGELDSAKELLRAVPDTASPGTLLLLADIAIEQNNRTDFESLKPGVNAAIEAFESFDNDDLESIAWAFARVSCKFDESAAAMDRINAIPSTLLPEVVQATLRVFCLRRAGDLAEAKVEAIRACDLVTNQTANNSVRRLGLELANLSLFDAALPLLKRVTSAESIGPHTEALLRCAYHGRDAEFLLEFCQALRANGALDRDVLHVEINVLIEFNCIRRALSIMGEVLSIGEDGLLMREVRTRRSQLALVGGQPELADFDAILHPAVEEVEPDFGLAVVQVLSFGPRPIEAVEYAYRLLRRNYNSPFAHKAMVAAVLFHKPHEVKLPEFDSVKVGAAVRYKIDNDGTHHWHIIEDDANPDPARSEYAPEHAISKRLLGLKIGATFAVRDDHVQTRTATILEIWSKYKLRFNRSMEEWQNLFPEEMFLWSFNIREDAPPDEKFSEMFSSVQQRIDRTKECDDLYRRNPLSVSNYAILVDTDVETATEHLSREADLPIRCCAGNDAEVLNAQKSFETERFILDPSALATLYVTKAFRHIAKMGLELHVSEGVLKEWRNKYFEKLNSPKEGGFLTKRNDEFVLVEESQDQLDQRLGVIREFLDFLDTTVPEDGLPLCKLSKDDASRMSQVVGHEAAEAVAIAKARNLSLWTDDACIAQLAHEQGVDSRIWTDFVFCALLDKQRVSLAVRSEVVSDLMRRGYHYCMIDLRCAEQIAVKGSWKLSDPGIESCIDWLSNPFTKEAGIRETASHLMLCAWKNTSEFTANLFVARIAEQIHKRPDGDRIVDELMSRLDRPHTFDVVARKGVSHFIRQWKKLSARLTRS